MNINEILDLRKKIYILVMDRKTRTKNFYNKINLEYFTKIKNFIHREEVWLSEYGGMPDYLLSNYENITLDIIKKNKDIPWNFNLISENKELSLEVIEYFSNLVLKEYPEFYEEFWGNISYNNNVTIDFYMKHFDLINRRCLVFNEKFSIDVIRQYEEIEWETEIDIKLYAREAKKREDLVFVPIEYWDEASKNRRIQLDWITYFLEKPWNWELLSESWNFKLEWLQRFPDKPWNINKICENNEIELTWLDFFQNSEWPFDLLPVQINFDISWVEKNPSKNWDWKFISISYNFDISWVDKYPDKKWNWEGISSAPNFDMSWVDKYPDKEWDWDNISMTHNFEIEWTEKYPNKPWNWEKISITKNLKIDWIEMYPDKEWDWDGLSQNENLHISWIEKYKEKPWCWGCIHDNDNFYNNFNLDMLDKVADIANFETLSLFKKVSLEWLEKYPDKPWNYEIISLNSDEYYLYHCRRYMAAYRIQQYWYKITISPEYKLGRKFIERKYNKLYEKQTD